MQSFIEEIKSVRDSVSRPVVIAVLNDLVEMTRMNIKNFVFRDGSPSAIEINAEQNAKFDRVNFSTREVLDVTADEEMDMNAVLTENIQEIQYYNNCVFEDAELGVRATPIYVKVKTTLNIQARFKDRNSADTWRNRCRRIAQQNRQLYTHAVKYSWLLPEIISVYLFEIYNRREKVAPTGESLSAWLQRCFVDRLTKLTTGDGERSSLAFTELQANVVGYFDFDGQPDKAERNADNGTWETSFSYVFNWEKPLSCHFTFPIMVHNQLLSSTLLPKGVSYGIPQYSHLAPSATQAAMQNLARSLYPRDLASPGIFIPAYDTWTPKHQLPMESLVMSILFRVDEQDMYDVYNMMGISNFEFDPLFLEFMQAYPETLTVRGENLLKFSLYRGDTLLDSNAITVSGALQVRSTAPLSLTTNQHLVITIVSNPAILSDLCVERLLSRGDLSVAYMKLCLPNVETLLGPIPIDDDNLLSRNYWDSFVRILYSRVDRNAVLVEGFWKRVGNYTVITN